MIRIERYPGLLLLHDIPTYILDYLQYSRREFELVGYQTESVYIKRQLYKETQDPKTGQMCIATYWGFYEKLRKLLDKGGDKYEVIDYRPPMPPVDIKAVMQMDWAAIKSSGLRDYQYDAVSKLLAHLHYDGGIVHATGGMGKTIVSACVYAAWHGLNTILAVPSRALLRQTSDTFKALFPHKDIGIVGSGCKKISKDITITTYASLDICATEKCEMLICDEIQRATGDCATEVLTSMTPLRVVGLSATIKNLFNRADKLLVGLFGPVVVEMDYQDAQEVGAVVPGVVYMVNVPMESRMVTATTPKGKISQGIERNAYRHKLIGQIASKVPRYQQCMVFVDHIATHLRELYPYLPVGSKFLHRDANKATLQGFALTPKQQEAILDEFKNNEFQHLLVTDMAREGFSHDNVRVVIQATGGTSEVELLQEAFRASRILRADEQARLNVPPKTHFTLVDFIDNQDEFLLSMSMKRMKIYEKQGWAIKIVQSPNEIEFEAHGPADSVKAEVRNS